MIKKIANITNRLINIGIHENVSSNEIRKIRLINSIAFLGLLISTSNSLLYLAMKTYSLFWPSTFGLIFFVLPVINHYKGQLIAAKYTSALGLPIYFTLYSLYIGEAIGLEYMLIVTALAPLMFFESRKVILPIFFFNILLFSLCKALFYWYPRPEEIPLYTFNYYFNSLVIFTVIFLIVNIFKSEHIHYEQEITRIHKNVTDSINYAARIQRSILQSPADIISNFKDGFIYYQAKNIVSGDFYYYHELNNPIDCPNADSIKIIISADCTGHGVPAGFLTVMGYEILNEIIQIEKTAIPHSILTKLDERISQRFKQGSEKYKIKDGMDMAILAIDEKNQTAFFSGAKQTMLKIRNNELSVFKSSKFPIGGFERLYKIENKFTSTKIPYEYGDKFYLYSDGFQDQFGGPKGRKYLSKRFKKYIEAISQFPMEQQKQALSLEINNWQNIDKPNKLSHYEQTDDRLIIGIEV